MSSLLARANAYQPLAPWERALLKLAEGVLIAGLVSAVPILINALTGQAHVVDWGQVGAAFAVGALVALLKLATAAKDPPLPTPTVTPTP